MDSDCLFAAVRGQLNTCHVCTGETDTHASVLVASMFPAEETTKVEEKQTKEDDFQTDEEEEEMEVETQAPQKRRKVSVSSSTTIYNRGWCLIVLVTLFSFWPLQVQAGRFQKKFKNHKERNGSNNGAKITNGK